MHAVQNKYAPDSFSNIFQLNASREIDYELRNTGFYSIPFVRIEFFKRFPLYTFPLAWNDLGDLRFQNNKITFQISLREYLLSKISALNPGPT